MQPKHEYVLCYVEWLDHTSDNDWGDLKNLALAPATCKSVGWLVKEDQEAIYLAAGRGATDGDVTCVQCILKTCILRTDPLVIKPPKKPKKKRVDEEAPPVL